MCCFVRRRWRHGLLPCPSVHPTRRTGKIGVLPVAGASGPSSPHPIDGVEFFTSNALKYFVRIDRATSPRPIGGVADGRRYPDARHFFAGVSRTHTALASRRRRSLVPPSGSTDAQRGRPSTRRRSRPSGGSGLE